MYRSNQRPFLIGIVALGLGAVLGIEPVAAQGLFRRLQERIQTRVESAIEDNARADQTASERSGADENGLQDSAGAAAAAQPAAPSVSDRLPEAGSSRERFGPSILARPARPGGANQQVQAADGVTSAKPSMGIQVVPVSEGTPGLKVAGIRPGSEAGKAGLQVNDLIVAVDGVPTPSIESIARILEQRQVGDNLRASVLRGQQNISVRIPLLDAEVIKRAMQLAEQANASGSPVASRDLAEPEPLPAPQATGDLIDTGIEVQDATGQRGVMVKQLRPGSPGAVAGLAEGDRIVSIDGHVILDSSTWQREFAERSLGDRLSVNVVRNQTLHSHELVLQADAPASAVDGLAQQNTKATEGSSPGSGANGSGSSVLGGLGSVLGGLFGGSASPQQNESSPSSDKGTNSMEGDEKQVVQRVGYDEEIGGGVEPLPADPPSIEELKPPVTTIPSIISDDPEGENEKDRIIQSLREEIRMLRQQLDALEKDRS